MIAELGHIALVLAALCAAWQSIFGYWGAQARIVGYIKSADAAAFASFVLCAMAFVALSWAFVGSDFSLAVVQANSHQDKPLIYKVAGTWGNHEGSLLLWVLILCLFSAALALFGRQLPLSLRGRVLGTQALIAIGFFSFMLLTSNPFERVEFPAMEGEGLNPLLQDIGLALHPPLLYLGYVGFSVAFSFAVAALIEGRVDPAWGRWVRPWTLAAWVFLTAGIALGSWWAYYELGWGGWWFWDPVENVSFMPWLTGTALLHCAIVVERRDALKVWAILLAILTFSLSLMGTFIVRSGLLTSVHAFAVDPERGLYILMLLVVAIGGALVLFIVRAPVFKKGGIYSPISREGGLLVNNMLLTAGTAIIFTGTLWPLVVEALAGQKISVGPPFYNLTFAPLMAPLVIFMGIGPWLSWKRADLSRLVLIWAVILAIAIAGSLVLLLIGAGSGWVALFGVGIAIWLIVSSFAEWCDKTGLLKGRWSGFFGRVSRLPNAQHGMSLAHAGMGVAVLGMVAASNWSIEAIAALKPGEDLALGRHCIVYEGAALEQGPNYQAEKGRLVILRNCKEPWRVLDPERRNYSVRAMQTTEAAIYSTVGGDYYAALGRQRDDGRRVVRAWFHSFVPWLWAGSIMMVLGGLLSLSDRRLRLGVPAAAKPKADKQ